MRRILAMLLPAAAVACCLTGPGRADDFRIETEVYVGNGKQPASKTTTLFRAGYVYDYISGSGQVAVFDRSHGRFILLDPARKLKAEIKIDKINEFIDGLHDLAANDSNSAIRFAADPDLKVKFQEDGELTLTSDHISYELKTEPAATPEAARQYHEFADWYARFNTMSHKGSAPPFPRLVVNAELAKRGLVPTMVRRTVPHATQVYSEHFVSWRLLEGDHRRIAETANQLATFQEVDFQEFLAPAVTKR